MWNESKDAAMKQARLCYDRRLTELRKSVTASGVKDHTVYRVGKVIEEIASKCVPQDLGQQIRLTFGDPAT
jgi:hypothetical protein